MAWTSEVLEFGPSADHIDADFAVVKIVDDDGRTKTIRLGLSGLERVKADVASEEQRASRELWERFASEAVRHLERAHPEGLESVPDQVKGLGSLLQSIDLSDL